MLHKFFLYKQDKFNRGMKRTKKLLLNHEAVSVMSAIANIQAMT
jgi:hypothetical protein